MADGEGGCGGAIFRADLGVDAREVMFDGLLAQDKLGGDLAIAAPGGHEAEDFDLARAETGGQRLALRWALTRLVTQRLIHSMDFGLVAELGVERSRLGQFLTRALSSPASTLGAE